MAGKFTAKHSAVRHSLWLNITCLLVLPLCDMILMEWAHRGSFSAEFWAQQFAPHAWSFLFGWLFLVFVYGALEVGLLFSVVRIIQKFYFRVSGIVKGNKGMKGGKMS